MSNLTGNVWTNGSDRHGELVTDEEMRESLRDLLDEWYEPFKMGDQEFLPSRILEECDPIGFRCAVADRESFLLDDGRIMDATEYLGSLLDDDEEEED